MTSACPGATSYARPKSRSGGLEQLPQPAPPLKGDAGHRFLNRREPVMTALGLNDLRQHSDVLRLHSGKSLPVRFLEPGDAEALQAYLRSPTTRSRSNRFLGA